MVIEKSNHFELNILILMEENLTFEKYNIDNEILKCIFNIKYYVYFQCFC